MFPVIYVREYKYFGIRIVSCVRHYLCYFFRKRYLNITINKAMLLKQQIVQVIQNFCL